MFTCSHLPTPVHLLPFTCPHSCSPALPHSRLVCACSVICSFSIHVAGVRTRLCLLSCVSICADPHYLVALVWPSFVLVAERLRSSPACSRSSLHVHPCHPHLLVPVCPSRLCAHLCSSPFVPTTWCLQPLVCVCIK